MLIGLISLLVAAEMVFGAGPDVRIFCGDARHAYRDPAVVWHDGTFHLFFTLVETEDDGQVFSYTAQSESTDLVRWTPPRKLTPRDNAKDYSSPGNVVHDGDEWVLCLQTYPRPGNRDDGTVRYGNENARLFTMRSRDLRTWGVPQLLKVKGPSVPEADMGRMIDPYLLRDHTGTWWCFYKQNGASISRSPDLRTWTPVGRTEAGENVCVLDAGDRYVMFHSPANGIGMKTSKDLIRWTDEPGLVTLSQRDWPWARGRLTAGAVADARAVPGVGKYLLFFHGSGPRTEAAGDFDRNASIGLVASDDLKDWRALWDRSDFAAVREAAEDNRFAATSGPATPTESDAVFDARKDVLYSAKGVQTNYLARRYGIPYRTINENLLFKTPPVGWMTWYSVKFAASDAVVMQNARAFREKFCGYTDERPVLWVDWEWYHEKMYSAGGEDHDLLTPRKTAYPRGLRPVSDDLRALGFIPALWVSVICDVRTNALWKAHPEWILGERRNWSGGVWGDPTAPGFCEEYVPELFRRYRDDWGFEAFKWDTIPNALIFLSELRGEMHDPTVTPTAAFRRMVEAARKTLGPDVPLESCAAMRDGDVLPMIDLFDSGRVGDDIFGWTEFCRQGIGRILSFAPFHSSVFWADADNLVLRPEHSTLAQARTRVSVYGLAGVPVTVGDPMAELDMPRIDLLRRIMPVVPVRPASLGRGRLTGTDFDMQVDFARDFGCWQIRAWSNLATNRERTVTFDAPKGSVVWDYWNDRPLAERTFTIAPCDTKVVRVTSVAARGPTLVSVSRHLTQGGYELASYSSDETGATGVVRCPGGETVKVTFLLPDGAAVKAASHPYERQERILRLRLTSEKRADVTFALEIGN